MKFSTVVFSALFFFTTLCAENLTQYVDPFLGVDGGGNVLPGPCLPFGMIRVGPDVKPPQRTTGYHSNQPIDGFTQNHVSGTGGGGRYGNFMMIPQTGEVRVSNYSSDKSDETAAAGYYSVHLKRWDVTAELTCSERTAFHRYSFPQNDQSHILLDLSRVIDRHRGRLDDGKCIDAFAEVVSDTEIRGYGVFIGGWGHAAPYKVFFHARFDRPFRDYEFWQDDEILPDAEHVRNDVCGFIGHFSTLRDSDIEVQISISYKHQKNATRFLNQTRNRSFEQQKQKADKIWNDWLQRVKVNGGTRDQRILFYTGFYRCLVMPTDITGDNPEWHSDKPAYWDYYCFWDTFRTLHPFLTLVAPDRQRDMVISLIDIYTHKGWLPDAWITGQFAFKQGGTNADVVIADALAKGLTGIDYETAYKGMTKNLKAHSDQPRKYGRHPEYLKYGYCPSHVMSGSSYTLEYAYNDFCVAQVAKALGNMQDYEKYIDMSMNCYNLFNNETKYFWARDTNNVWAPDFSPTHHGDPWWEGPYFYEGTPAHYATYVPHDVQGLINRHGGKARFVDFLDNLFEKGYYTHVNEPDIMTPFLYIYAGAPYRTAERTRFILQTEYEVSRTGLPGNDDSGCMSSWYLFAAMGFYPNAGQDIYFITSPLFEQTQIDLQNGERLTITAENLSDVNIYIQSATLNGKPWNKAWFQHKDIIDGAELVLRMGPEPSDWGQKYTPPSISKP
ncbi:MAG: GH92 family glycosyl hydrolase [candidate division KSB1 bacterium]|nr:GH92 family glycosyl hydrolase [candidate division KSB1 bacterium]